LVRVQLFDRYWRFPADIMNSNEGMNVPGCRERAPSLDQNSDHLFDFSVNHGRTAEEENDILSAKLVAFATMRQYLQLDFTEARVRLELHMVLVLVMYASMTIGPLFTILLCGLDAENHPLSRWNTISILPGIVLFTWDTIFLTGLLMIGFDLSRRLNVLFDGHIEELEDLYHYVGALQYSSRHSSYNDAEHTSMSPLSGSDFQIGQPVHPKQVMIREHVQRMRRMTHNQSLFGMKIDAAFVKGIGAALVTLGASSWVAQAHSLTD